MPDLTEVSLDVSDAARAFSEASSGVTFDAMLAGHTTVPEIEAYIAAHREPVLAAWSALSAAVRRDIATAVEVERDRSAECVAAVRDAREACVETRAILEPTVWKLAEAQDVHRAASSAYGRAFDDLQKAIAEAGWDDDERSPEVVAGEYLAGWPVL